MFNPSFSPTLQLDANQQDVLDLTSELFVSDAANNEVLRFMPVPGGRPFFPPDRDPLQPRDGDDVPGGDQPGPRPDDP